MRTVFFTAKPGTLFFFSSGELHSAVSGDGGEIGFESIVFHPAILCGIATMSEGHFCRTFKEYTLKTPVEYINSLRVARAMELLNSTDMKIVDVAMETGFNNQSYFIGVFSKFVGTTPAKFRKTEKR